MMWKVQLFKLNYDERERNAAADVVAGGWLTMGERITAFETQFEQLLGGNIQCTAVANGTAALHMALLGLDVGPGDEVIIPALTFVADANVVGLVGAKAVAADCTSIDNWNMSAETIARCITSKTKAVMVVHYAGFPCDMAPIAALCLEKGIPLIEDVAHAPGASIGGRACGAWGAVGCFSFFSNKNIAVGEGGMVSVRDPLLHQRMRHLRSHGMSTLTLDRHLGRARTYDVVTPGLNYRMDEIRAALGSIQLDKLASANLRRGELSARYRHNLAGSRVAMPFAHMAADAVSAYHILPTLLPVGTNRDVVIDALKEQGIQSSIHYPPFWHFTAYKDKFNAASTPLTADIALRELTMPLYPDMTDAEVDLVTTELLKVVE